MHLFFLFASIFLLITMISSIFVYRYDKKIGLFIPLSFIVISITYYFIGLIFGSFSFGIYFLLLYLSIGVFSFVECIKKHKTNRIFTKGYFFFFIIFVLSFIYCYRYRLCNADEFYHWSPMVRAMFTHDKYYAVCGIEAGLHPEYPPFFSILEYVFCILYGSYSESILSTCVHIVSMTFVIVPFIDIFELKIRDSFLLFCGFLLLILSFDKFESFRSFIMDIPLALISSFPIILIFSDIIETRFGKFYYGLAQGCVLLTKQLGLVFYFLNLLLYIIVYIKKKKFKDILLDLTIFMALSILLYTPWLIYIYFINSNVGLSGQFSIVTIMNKILNFQIYNKEIDILKKIVDYILLENVFNSKINIYYSVFYLIIILMIKSS